MCHLNYINYRFRFIIVIKKKLSMNVSFPMKEYVICKYIFFSRQMYIFLPLSKIHDLKYQNYLISLFHNKINKTYGISSNY